MKSQEYTSECASKALTATSAPRHQVFKEADILRRTPELTDAGGQ